jgi:hypothetical protein
MNDEDFFELEIVESDMHGLRWARSVFVLELEAVPAAAADEGLGISFRFGAGLFSQDGPQSIDESA